MSDIISVNIGVVSSIEKKEDSYLVCLDDGFSAHIPLEHPVRKRYINQNIYFPNFYNNAIALITYSNQKSDWLPARIAISIKGNIVINKKLFKFNNLSFDQFLKLSNEYNLNHIPQVYAVITSIPVPSGYGLYSTAQFAQHNYNTIKFALENSNEKNLVDIAYSYSKELGYSLIYIQPSRFTQEYCKNAGIPTSKEE